MRRVASSFFNVCLIFSGMALQEELYWAFAGWLIAALLLDLFWDVKYPHCKKD